MRHRLNGRAASLLAPILLIAGCATAADGPLPTPDANGAYYTWTPQEQLVGYRKMEKVFPTRTVRRGPRVAALRAGPELAIHYIHAGEPWTAERYMQATNATGVLVLHRGQIVLERYRAGHGRGERWTSFSVAKSMSSTLVGAAVKDGHIRSLEDPVIDYLPALKGSAYEGVTVRHLLNMTSGVRWNEDYADPNADVARIRAEPAVGGADPILAYMRRLPREAPPGTKFVYKTGETHLVGALVRAAVGKDLADYLSEKVWAAYGMEKDAVWILDPAGHEYAGCCISATLRDFGRFGLFFLNDAKIDGASITPAGWTQMATSTSDVARRPTGGYGFQWWTTAGPAYQAIGIFGQQIHINPDLDLVVVVNSAWPSASHRENNAARAAFIGAVEAAVGAR